MIWFDLLVIILVAATLIKGFSSGLIMQIASLAGIILGAMFAGKVSEIIAPKFIEWFEGSPHVIGALSYIASFLLILIGLLLLGKMVQSFVKAVKLNTINRIAGAAFCCAKWMVLFSILINVVAEMDQKKLVIKDNVRSQSYTYMAVTSISQIVVPYLKFDWITKDYNTDSL